MKGTVLLEVRRHCRGVGSGVRENILRLSWAGSSDSDSKRDRVQVTFAFAT